MKPTGNMDTHNRGVQVQNGHNWHANVTNHSHPSVTYLYNLMKLTASQESDSRSASQEIPRL